MYGWAHRRVALADLIAFAWSAPMRDLATRMQMSDVGLKKLLRAHGVLGPPQGHWNRVHAGRRVSEPPAAPARRPGEKPYIHVDDRFVDLPEAPLPSSAGPFGSAKVPENLEELRTLALKAVGRPASAMTITVPHPAIAKLRLYRAPLRYRFHFGVVPMSAARVRIAGQHWSKIFPNTGN